MGIANSFLGVAASPAIGILLEATVKVTVILAVAAILTFALRRASAAYRHVVWVCAFCAVLVLPALLALPALRVSAPALSWLQPVPRPEPTNPAPPFEASTQAQDDPVGQATQAPNTISDSEVSLSPPAPRDTPPAAATTDPSGGARGSAILWPTVGIVLWALGALTVLVTFLAGYRELRRLLRSARSVRDSEWNALAMEAADRLRLTAPFALLRGEDLPVPVALGLVRPRILLPAESDSWPLELRRAVLLHELAHVKRHDCLTQAIAQVVCSVFWFNPVVWWAASKMRTERERACDDCVLIARTRPTDYAEHLLGVVRSLRARRLEAMGAVAFARPSSLEGRLLAVLDPIRDRRAVGLRAASAAAMIAAVLAVPLAVLEPVQAYTVRVQPKRALHAESDPNTLRPSRLVAVPAADRSLEERAAWARAEAGKARERVWWIGWRMELSPTLKGNLLSDTEGISLWILDQRGLFTLEDVIAGRDQGTSKAERSSDGQTKTAAVLVRMSGGTADRLRIQSLALPADFRGEPLYWMDAVPDEQGVAWLRETAGRARDVHMRRQLTESLGFVKRSDLVTPFLKSTLEGDAPDEVRAGAAEGLGHHPSSEVVRLLAKRSRSDRSLEVRRSSVEALGQHQTPEALEELLAIARAAEGNEVARKAAFDALGEKVSERAFEEGHPVEDVDEESAVDPEDKESPSETHVEVEFQDEPSSPMAAAEFEIQRQAIESLGRYPEAQSLPRLRRIAETSPYGMLRAQAVESIGRLGTPAALELLEQIAWKNGMGDARRNAVEMMGRHLPADRALEKLPAIARSHPSSDTRRTAVEMLGRVDSPRAVGLLQEIAAKGADSESQRQAVESLGRRGEPGVEDHLIKIVRTHRSIDVRRQAVESLGRREGKHVSGELLEIARGEGPVDVQRQAVESLGRLDADVMGDLAKIARTHPSSEVRHQAVESMRRRDPDQALRLIEDILRQPKGKEGS